MPRSEPIASTAAPRRRTGVAQRQLAIAFGAAAAAAVALIVTLVVLQADSDGAAAANAGWTAAAGLAAGLGVLWLILDWRFLRPLARFAAGARFIAETHPVGRVTLPEHPALGTLPEAVDALCRRLGAVEREFGDAVAAATGSVEEQKQRLEAILSDLAEGVLVCNLDHQVLLYNQVALALLHLGGELGLGRSLFTLITREPILHALELLLGRPESDPALAIVAATTDSSTLLTGRMSLVRDATRRPTGYVLTFNDATRDIAEHARRDALLREAVEGLRAPLANLRAAAETAAAFPDLAPERRREFEQVMLREAAGLSDRLATLDHGYQNLAAATWPMADLYSTDLFSCVARRLAESGGPRLTITGLPLWLHGDSHSLALALEHVARCLARATGRTSFDLEALLSDRHIYAEIAWDGEAVASPTLDGWRAETLAGSVGPVTLGRVLERHNSEMWSRETRPGRAILRMPLPASRQPALRERGGGKPPARPEFYDFDLLALTGGHALDAAPLRTLPYVVFDTETTGLRPSDGDEIVSIGAVRVLNGRILTGETFSRLVDPRRTIPVASIRFHGITDAMVAGSPPIEVVLPQFRDFVADAVLVAYNAAFDLKFLKLKETASGVRFDNVALDALLIAAFLFPDLDDLSLDGLAARLGIDITDRHSALGDAMATAAVFTKLLELLERCGVDTLGQLLAASRMTFEIRARQAHF
ncbi:MAG: PAS domain-containing protein [Proteobacteria bacterium]|nr:PAS domain-containing protein [Pseudomonadota bacterium]